jgi:hypothetical protein
MLDQNRAHVTFPLLPKSAHPTEGAGVVSIEARLHRVQDRSVERHRRIFLATVERPRQEWNAHDVVERGAELGGVGCVAVQHAMRGPYNYPHRISVIKNEETREQGSQSFTKNFGY